MIGRGVEYKLQEDEIQTRRLSWPQSREGGSKIIWPKRVGNTVSLRCWNLPQAGQQLDELGGLPPPVACALFFTICDAKTGTARGTSRITSKFFDGALRLAARVQAVDGIDSFFPSLLLLFELGKEGRIDSIRVSPH